MKKNIPNKSTQKAMEDIRQRKNLHSEWPIKEKSKKENKKEK